MLAAGVAASTGMRKAKRLWGIFLIVSLVRHRENADLDPLMYTIMEEPVILPTSKVSIDLATIKSHLLSDPHDPFNRVPMKIEDVVDDVEMKAKIEAFLVEMKTKAKAVKEGKMDLTEG